MFLFLDKVWEFDNHTEWYQENQGKLGNMAKYYDCTALENYVFLLQIVVFQNKMFIMLERILMGFMHKGNHSSILNMNKLFLK